MYTHHEVGAHSFNNAFYLLFAVSLTPPLLVSDEYLLVGHILKSALFFFFTLFIDVDHCLKTIIEFVAILLLFYVLAFWAQGMWDPSSPTCSPCDWGGGVLATGPPGKSQQAAFGT